MKTKLFNFLLILTFQVGYLEWGHSNHEFIFEAEKEIFSKALTDFMSIVHPLILIPFIGMVLLIITFFQRIPDRKLTLTGLACLSIFILLLFFIGIISLNMKILLSTIPFLATGIVVVRNNRRKDSTVSITKQ